MYACVGSDVVAAAGIDSMHSRGRRTQQCLLAVPTLLHFVKGSLASFTPVTLSKDTYQHARERTAHINSYNTPVNSFRVTLNNMYSGAPRQNIGGNNKLPPYTGVSPRATAQNYTAHRGEYISIIFELSGPGEFTCGASGQSMRVVGVPEAVEVSRVCEFICYVDPATSELIYYQHAMLDDEFDFDVYRRLVNLTSKYPQLF